MARQSRQILDQEEQARLHASPGSQYIVHPEMTFGL